MRHINLENWARREHFELFNTFDYPHFSMCADVDLTAFYPAVRRRGVSFTVATAYVLARAANAIPEFRFRIRKGEVVEYEVIHPAITILSQDDIFGFCCIDYIEDFTVFAAGAAEQIAYAKEQPALTCGLGRDDWLYITAIPWVSFTSVMHPLHLSPVDSVPRFAWGKYFGEGELIKMPLSVQGHHAVMDGLHMGRFYERVQDYLDHPDSVLGEE